MTNDNRTNEPNQNETKSGQTFCFTEAQVEAAAEAMAHANPTAEEPWAEMPEFQRDWYRRDARAALVAAQGAAPQAEVKCEHERQERLGGARMCSGCGQFASAKTGEFAPAPVLPSSTVDEDALAEMFDGVINRYFDQQNDDSWEPLRVLCARAVAEWLKEQVR